MRRVLIFQVIFLALGAGMLALSGCGTGGWSYPSTAGKPGGAPGPASIGSGPDGQIVGIMGKVEATGEPQRGAVGPPPEGGYPEVPKYPKGGRVGDLLEEDILKRESELSQAPLESGDDEEDRRLAVARDREQSEARASSPELSIDVLRSKPLRDEKEEYFVEGIVIDSVEYSVSSTGRADTPAVTKQSVLVKLEGGVQVRADAMKYLHVKVGDKVSLEVMQRHIEDITKRKYIVYTKIL